jgi:DNA repair protein RecO (recombination protein O)
VALHKTRGVVIGRRAFGESDRLVDFYTRDYGKVRGIARAARRTRSRFGSALELFTLGEMVFFDTGRSELVQVDLRRSGPLVEDAGPAGQPGV